MSELEEKAVLISVLEDLFNKTEENPDYVETSEILAFAIEVLERYDECDLMELAQELQDADVAVEMHPEIAKFVVSVYESEIEDGNSDAMCNLGAMYYVGRFGVQSYEKAFELYEMSYEAGNIQAAENLGYCYYYGRFVNVDYEKAFKYFTKGALIGSIRSLYKVADFYRYGYFVDQDTVEAYNIYMRCMETMTEDEVDDVGADIFVRVGDCSYEGVGTPVDIETAYIFYSRAEILLYQRLMQGDYFMKDNLKKVQERLEIIRKQANSSIFEEK